MTSDSRPLDLLRRALQQTQSVIDGVRPDQAALPTPCASWDVKALLNHVVRDTHQFARMARGGAYERGESDVPMDEFSQHFRQGAAGLLDTWSELWEPDAAAVNRISQQVAEFAVHSWDVAKATQQPVPVDDEVAGFALDWARGALKPEFRGDEASGKVFGPEVPIADDAPLHDRLAAFFGRQPFN